MSDSSKIEAVYLGIVLVSLTIIVAMQVRAFRRGSERAWPFFFVALYDVVLLLLYLLGMFTQANWEGFGFLPLLVLTLPWSRLIEWIFDYIGISNLGIWGNGLAGTLLINFVIYNVLSASANSYILYLLLRRRQRKVADDAAWEQARRNR